MNVSVHLRPLLAVLALALAVGGCRTYGGYGSEAETLDQIQQANALFAEDFQRAQGDQAALQRAAASNPALGRFAEAFAAVLEAQQAVVAEHRLLAEEAAAHRRNYRVLNQTYGAIISDQQIIRDRYAEILADVQRTVEATPARPVDPPSRYQVVPQFYQRIAYANARRSLADLLDRAQTGSAPPPAPDTTAAN